MSDGVMENYGNIEWLYGRSAIHLKRIKTLEEKIEMLDTRILKLEAIIVELANIEPTYSMEDLAEIALEQRANEDEKE